MTGAGRHAAPYLHHPTLPKPGEGLPVDRFSFLPSAGHRQKRVDSYKAGRTRFRVISSGLYSDRRRLLSTLTPLAAGLGAGSPQPRAVEIDETRDRFDCYVQVLCCSTQWSGRGCPGALITRCMNANRKSSGFLLFFSLGSTVGRRQASRQQQFWSGRHWVCRCRSLDERRRRGTQRLFRGAPPGWHMCNWRRKGPVASAVDNSRFFFLENGGDDTPGIRSTVMRTGRRQPFHAQLGCWLFRTRLMDGQRPGCP